MDFKEIIKEQKQELKDIEKSEKIIDREKFNIAKKYLKYPNILAILGVRRCGKSIFSYLLSKDYKTGYINFDDERLIGLKTEDLNKILESFYQLYGDIEYIILDEIQNITGWELFANRLRRTKKVILTGSNSKLLSGELSTHLTGRYIDITLFPFSFREFLKLKSFETKETYTTKEKAEILNLLKEYLQTGGFPETIKFGKAMTLKIYDNIITKDVITRHKVNKIDEIKKLSKYLISNSAKEFSYNKLSKILDIKHNSTTSNWINHFEEAFLIFVLEKFDFKLKQQFLAPKKVYCIDPGLLSAISFKFSEDKGRIIENEVALDLFRKKIDNFFEIYYWKDYFNNEVDFVIKKGKTIKQLIQVCYIETKEDLPERETNSLLKASEKLKCKNLLIITWNYQNEEIINGKKIKFVPLWKWLLLNNSPI